jgi:predicted RNase H-like nuclease (RuvC/YqgF family)
MPEIEDKVMEAIKELERWKGRREKVKARLDNDNADKSELERIDEQITHYQKLLQDMKKKLASSDVSRTIARSGNQ